MADKKSPDDRVQEARETARKIWLAGIGAYGRAFSEAQDAIKGMSKDTSRVFEDLVQKGESLEATVQEKSKEFVEKTRASTDEFSDTIDDRIKDMRARLARGAQKAGESGGKSGDVEARLSAIEAKLDKIMTHLEPKKTAARKTAARKTAAKKPAPKKPAPKKAAPRKPAPRKSAAKK